MEKRVLKMPVRMQKIFANLVEDLEQKGPLRTEWPNYSGLGEDRYHCHLSYRWVACWLVVPDVREIEVYYAGSREDAPY